MPEDPVPGRAFPWLALGRLLPERLRTRVFEPAYFDALAEARRRRWPLGLRVAGLVLETCRVGWLVLLAATWRAAWFRVALVLAACGLALSAFMAAAYRYQ